MATPRPDADLPLKRLGDFEILREIGRGGMGVVYEARQVSLNRPVALKVLPPGLGLTEQAVQRFHREAQAAAKLHHTHIVPVYAVGEAQGCHYYAMELIEDTGDFGHDFLALHYYRARPPREEVTLLSRARMCVSTWLSNRPSGGTRASYAGIRG
jgi:serine/threonine protein kinase